MEILLIFFSFILVIIIIVMWKIKLKNQNKVHFYVARDKTHNLLWLYIGKPIRFKDDDWLPGKHGTVITMESYFVTLGLNKEDYNSLKWEDEPIEVFLNLKD